MRIALAIIFAHLRLIVNAQSPSNDSPCQALQLNVTSICVFNEYTTWNATGTVDVAVPPCAEYNGSDVWFKVTVPLWGSLTLNTQAEHITDGGMAVYSGSCDSLYLIECDDDDGNGFMPKLTLTSMPPGSELFIRFWEYEGNDNGTFSICASTVQPCTTPLNHTCATGDPIACLLEYHYCSITNIPSLGGGGIYGCVNSTPNSNFFYFLSATSGPINLELYQLNNNGDSLDVDYVIWEPFSSPSTMCNNLDASVIIDCGFASVPSIQNPFIPAAVTGSWYMILIANFSNQSGTIFLRQTNYGEAGAGGPLCLTSTLSQLATPFVINTYPNPFIDELHVNITGLTSDASMEVFNVVGKCIFQRGFARSNNIHQAIDFSTFSSGAYILRLTTNYETRVDKIIKQ